MYVFFSFSIVVVPTPEINLNTSDVYYVAGSSLVLSCEMILSSENIDNDTVAVFVLKRNVDDDVWINDTSVSKVMYETKFIYTAFLNLITSTYQMQENTHVQVLLMML